MRWVAGLAVFSFFAACTGAAGKRGTPAAGGQGGQATGGRGGAAAGGQGGGHADAGISEAGHNAGGSAGGPDEHGFAGADAGAADAPVFGSAPHTCADVPPLSTIGCEFYAYETYGQVTTPDQDYVTDNAFQDCYAVFLANASDAAAGLSVDRRGQRFADLSHAAFLPVGAGTTVQYQALPDGKIPAGQMAVLFLAGGAGRCPGGITPLVVTGAATIGDGMDSAKKSLLGYAFHITTDAPVAAQDVFPYFGHAMGSTTLVPPSAWGSQHEAVDPGFEGYLQGGFGVVAQEDNTRVEIVPTQDIGWEDAPATPAFTRVARMLNKGDLLQVVHKRYLGSQVIADKPIGQWAMHQCFIMGQANSTECDNVHQIIPSLQSWGSESIGVAHRARDDRAGGQENALWRLVGAVDGTTLSYSGSTPTGAPASLKANEEVWFRSDQPFAVKSQDASHPFLLLAHMTSCSELAGFASDCRGDSEMVPVVPTQQFLTSYTFATHPLLPETNLVIVRSKGASGFSDVTLDCLDGAVAGWQDVGSTAQYARVDLSRHDFATQGRCANGWHRMESSSPFTATVWQWGTSETEPGLVSQKTSIGFTVGGNAIHLNSVLPTAPTAP